MKLTPRFTVVFILYAIALLIGVGVPAYNSGRDSLRSATFSELQAIALEKEASLNRWVEEKKDGITALADNPTVISAAAVLIQENSPETAAAHDEFLANIQPRVDNVEFLEVSLIHPQTGQILVSTEPNEEGEFKADRPYFLNGKLGSYVQSLYYSNSLQTLAMTASAPIEAPDGQLLGVLAGRLDLEEMNAIISRRTGLHKTDDSYLVGTSNKFVTQPRFISDPVVFERDIHTEDIIRCLQQESGVIGTTDYRNMPTIVTYRWLPEQGLCLVIKIDETEALRPVRAFGRTILVISIVALLAAVGLAVALSRTLTKPILALQLGAERFGRGELDTRLTETSRDELGQLAGEFNKMAEALAEQQTFLRRRAEQFFNLTLDLLCTIDSSGVMLDLNPAWEHNLGYSREELRGQLVTSLVHPEDLGATISALQEVTNTSPIRFENRCQHKNGHYRWLAWMIVISPQDQLLYAAARDITKRRLAEERLRQQTEELERSNQELEQFTYVASHDLQEPLRQISGYLQLLTRRYQGRLDEDADEFIGFALEGTNRLKRMIDDLIEYSRVGALSKDFSRVDMEQIFRRVLDQLRPEIQESAAMLTNDPLPAVLGDDRQLQQLLQNLIGNAIKFRGIEPPKVHVGATQLGENWLFFIRDNGIGIDPQYTERIFVVFQRLYHRDEYSGTGMGLAISRKIVERHGGRIWVDSEPGKGTTFYFTLQPAESLLPVAAPMGVSKPRTRDTIADRATDLI